MSGDSGAEFVPQDQVARDRIGEDVGASSLFVEAGAGTGKTTALVSRLARTLGSGAARMDQIVAITFTEAAAGELSERLRAALDRCAVDQEGPAAFRHNCAQARNEFDRGVITTIHGFASRLLTMFATEAGIPFSFDVLDAIQSRLAFDEQWRRFASATLANPSGISEELQNLLQTGFVLGATPAKIKALYAKLDSEWQDATALMTAASGSQPRFDPSLLRRAIAECQSLAATCATEDDKLLTEYRRRLVPFVESLEGFEDLSEASQLRLLRKAPGLPGNKGAQKNWPGNLDDFKTSWVEVKGVCDNHLDLLQRWYLNSLCALVATQVVAAAAERVRSGKLSFQDLLVLARNVLRDNAEVRAKARSTFTHIFVDEFQDTDALQAELIDLLTNTSEPNAASLFTVGDPRQSIYKFRRAEPELFSAMRSSRDPNDVVRLEANFRTQGLLVNWVNECFSILFAGDPQVGEGELVAVRDDLFASLKVLGVDEELPDKVSADELREIEARHIGELCRKARDEAWVVEDHGVIRGARFSDIAILYPSRRVVGAFEQALEREGVPYRIESRENIWESQEVRDLMNVLGVLANPEDAIALVGALRSIVFACSDVELFDWHRTHRRWGLDVPVLDTQQCSSHMSVHDGVAVLAQVHALRHWVTVSELLDVALEATDVFAKVCVYDRPRDSWDRIRFMQDVARNWDADSSSGLAGFLHWARNQAAEGAGELASINPDPHDDAVRLMTIHASKGLEFPIVFIAGMGGRSSRPEGVRVLWDATASPEVSFGKTPQLFATDGFAEREAQDKARDEDEAIRLAYVACTRARDHLFVSTYSNEKSSLASRLLAAIDQVDPPNSQPGVMPAGADAVSDGLRDEVRNGPRDEIDLAALVPTAAVGRGLSGTAAAKAFGIARSVKPRWPADRAVADAARRFGSAVHSVLEHHSLSGEVDRELCSHFAAEFELPERADDVARSVSLALESELVREAASAKAWRELDLVGPLDDFVLHGQADLIFERGDGLVIVDWKTDVLEDARHGEELLAYYKWQLVTYASVVSQVLAKPVAEVCICLISPTQEAATVLRVGDLAAATEDYRHSLDLLRSTGSLVGSISPALGGEGQ